jgi:Transposase DDE domain
MQSKELQTNISELFQKSLESIEKVHGFRLNKSRTDFIELVILGLVSSRSVQFGEIADKMTGDADTESKQRRIQRFVGEYDVNYEFFACFLLLLLPKQGKLKICIDRTEWEFGEQNHNILVLTAYSHGVGIPIWFEVLDNEGGNSHSDDRMYVMMKLIDMIGKERICCVIADCEFIGEEWINWLALEKITFYIDVRTNQFLIHNQKKHRISSLLKYNKTKILNKVQIFGLQLGFAMMATAKAGKKSLAIITNHQASGALCNYKCRWSIEVLFANMKTKGFNLELTHLKCPIRLRKLFALVASAFAICFLVGLVAHKSKPIKTKNHGYKANSFFRNGLNILRKVMKSNSKIDFKSIIDQIIEIINKNLYVIQKIVM